MNISFDDDVDTANSIQFEFLVLVFPPVTFSSHVAASGVEFSVSFDDDGIFVQGRS